MPRTARYLAGLLLLVAWSLPSRALRAQMASSASLDCSTIIFSDPTNCGVTLREGQKSVQLVFALRGIPTTETPPIRLITVVSDHCCTDSTVYLPGANGFYAVRWSGENTPTGTVNLSIYHGAEPRQIGSIRLSTETKRAPSTLAVSGRERDHAYVWTRTDWIPSPVHVEIDSLDGRALTPESCAKIRFKFRPGVKSEVTPDSGTAEWRPSQHGRESGACTVRTRWRLADATGRQDLQLTLGDGSRVAQERIEITGVSREGPRLAAGFGIFSKLTREAEVTCGAEPDLRECQGLDADEKVAGSRIERNGGEPYFSLEIPVFAGYLVGARGAHRWTSEHVRLVLGSTFERPKDNYFVGLAVLPILSSAAERSPFQLSGGYLPRQGGWYGGLSLDTSNLVKPILSVLGFSL